MASTLFTGGGTKFTHERKRVDAPPRSIKATGRMCQSLVPHLFRTYSTQSSETRQFEEARQKATHLRIGDAMAKLHTPSVLLRVPPIVGRRHASATGPIDSNAIDFTSALLDSDEALEHLRWMAQKDSLGQDMLLIGPPGSFRRQLAVRYAALTRREVEYVALQRDVSETDIKQRRELSGGTSSLDDQPAVRAALNGSLLILDGLEKAERNLLPIINNLLENREMPLEDGRVLISHTRFDELAAERGGAESLERAGLLRVSEDFRVVALTLPVPRYSGHPLDPPLRSRFQARNVPSVESFAQQEVLRALFPSVPVSVIRRVVDLHMAAELLNNAVDDSEQGEEARDADHGSSTTSLVTSMPELPERSMHDVARHLQALPATNATSALVRAYPYHLVAAQSHDPLSLLSVVHDAREQFDFGGEPLASTLLAKHNARVRAEQNLTRKRRTKGARGGLGVPDYHAYAGEAGAGRRDSSSPVEPPNALSLVLSEALDSIPDPAYEFVALRTSDADKDVATLVLRETAQTKNERELACFCGPLALGSFSDAPNFSHTTNTQRLITALLEDHALGHDLFVVGQRGSGKTAYVKELARLLGYTDAHIFMLYSDMSTRDLLQRRSTANDGTTGWTDSPLVSAAKHGGLAVLDGAERLPDGALASLHSLVCDRQVTLPDGTRMVSPNDWEVLLESHSHEELVESGVVCVHRGFRVVVTGELPTPKNRYLSSELMSMFRFHTVGVLRTQDLRELLQLAVPHVDPSLLGALLAFASALQARPHLAIELSLRQILLILRTARLRPQDVVEDVRRALLYRFMPPSSRQSIDELLADRQIGFPEYRVDPDDTAFAQATHAAEGNNVGVAESHLIPNVMFVEISLHKKLLNDMTRAFMAKEHILLIGNQGVGKNKLADYFLSRLRRPRQYMQLHRDTTVQSLTLRPTMHQGVLSYEDSPLVVALREGHVLVIDEADKAPLEVVVILKSLVDGTLMLADGRRVVSHDSPTVDSEDDRTLRMHPEFQMIVLANRPGFPFLGQDFWSQCGDLFSCHAIDNPDLQSELELLAAYGPSVPRDTLVALARSMADLRERVERGLLAYPYSTREAVNVVKHLEAYPNDPLVAALENVFSFDAYDPHVRRTITDILRSHGFQLDDKFLSTTETSGVAARRGVGAKKLTAEYTRDVPKDANAPKHGKVDPTGAPHVGGNTWAGGTGGSDTAGLGGKGGPYRLSDGNPVHQLSDEEKARVPEEVKQKAMAMARDALKRRLDEIDMSPGELSQYEQLRSSVQAEIGQMRVILRGLQSNKRERVWLKHQTSGELDETKFVDSVAGERNVFKRRARSDDGFRSHEGSKRIEFVFDVSGSMYRFNGYDGRLDRALETAVMVMESFADVTPDICEWGVRAHSGEESKLVLIEPGNPPRDRKERYQVLQRMVAHTQFTLSGDNTLRGTQRAIDDLAGARGDGKFVIVFSDANLPRYGISPEEFASVLTSNADVQAYAIFIASLGPQAEHLQRGLPAGRGHVCFDSSDLPRSLSAILSGDVFHSTS